MKLTLSAKIALLNGLLLIFLTLSEFLGFIKFPLLLSYNWHKLLHLTGVIIFMGNMIVGPIWFSYAYYKKETDLLRFACNLLQLTDTYLTVPGMALTVINGLFLASAYGGTKNQPWLFYSFLTLLGLWALSVPLIYIQEKLYHAINETPQNITETDKWLFRWSVLGSIISVPPVLIFYWMVAKAV